MNGLEPLSRNGIYFTFKANLNIIKKMSNPVCAKSLSKSLHDEKKANLIFRKIDRFLTGRGYFGSVAG